MTYKTYRGDRGGRDEQKIIWEGGSKMQPWGVMGQKLFLGLVDEKILSKSRLHFRLIFCMAEL